MKNMADLIVIAAQEPGAVMESTEFEEVVSTTIIVEQEEQVELRSLLNESMAMDLTHPLQNEWTLWYDVAAKRNTGASWSDNLKEIITISTVEEFWGYEFGLS